MMMALYTLFRLHLIEVLFINRALFQKNGVPEPVNPMTFDELRKSAKLINEKSGFIWI